MNDKPKSCKNSKQYKWIVQIVLWTFVISMSLSFFSNTVLEKTNIYISVAILLLIIIINVMFDIIGLAIATADEKPFHSMSAKQVKGGKTALRLLKNADKAASFCNDVIGDIAGIVSGSAVVVISISLSKFIPINHAIITLVVTALVASLTIGGKAVGKNFAMKNSNSIVYKVALFISLFTGDKAKKNKR